METTLIFWIIACLAFILIEALTQQLVALWFVTGSAFALILSLFDINFQDQMILFVLVSSAMLLFLRPFLKRFMSDHITATNSDSNIGELAIVIKDFEISTHEGRILVNNMDWAARSLEGIDFHQGDKVVVEKIEGVKCLVKKA